MVDPEVLLVDGANVVGSRPDGWWRDRAGAAARLHRRLAAAGLAGHVVLVLEGRARAGVGEGVFDGIEVVHAPRDGDSLLLELASERFGGCRVVTADRELSRLLAAVGAEVVTPGWLLGRLPDDPG